MFGGYDTQFNASEIQWNPLILPSGYSSIEWWSIDINVASYGSTSFLIDGTFAVIDTGTSYMYIPLADFNALTALWIADAPSLSC
jgi:hypothetical protein